MMGLNVYVQRDMLNRWLQEGDVASQFDVALEPGCEARMLEARRCRAWRALSARPRCCTTSRM